MMNRDDYKAVKRMDKKQMEEYLQRIYKRGYEAGLRAAKSPSAPPTIKGIPGKEENT
jgi:hypothetical protein